MSDRRRRVAVVYGGQSSEHAVSCVSAGSVIAHLDPERFEVLPVGITPSGAWVLGTADVSVLSFGRGELPSVDPGAASLALAADPSRSGDVIALEPARAGEVLGRVDVVFPVLHGPRGEDGTLQGLLELAGVPYVGAGVLASAAGMDKEFTKKLLAAEDLPVGEQVVLRPGTDTLTVRDRERLGLPVFVKPARAGSSFGITRVSSWDALDAAIAVAREHDPKVLVEAAMVGREVECGVLELPDGRLRASVLAEIRLAVEPDGARTDPARSDGARPDQAAFYDFETKYLGSGASYDVPATLDDTTTKQIQEMAVAAFRALDGQGLARVDFFVTADGPVINEVNTMPGFTTTSMYPRMWAASGIDYPTLLSTLIDTAIARGTGLR